ncbi:CD3337/EF1877 family mobilome membrane protein [Liquorilactobacillus hordei]|uniref:CD3337/EF1877 family mobilome membrane protein n=1 Tax=Liquorilactobacillus hordei TaxID=468911 RepID=UPI0039EA3B67
MKIKKLVPIVLIALGFLFIGSTAVHADNGLDSVKKAATELAKQAAKKYSEENYYTAQDVKQGGVTLNSERYPIDQYKGYADLNTTTHPVKDMIRGVGNTFFYINKLIWQGFDKVINLLSTTDVLNGKIDQINSAAASIWQTLIDNFLALILVVVAIAAGYTFALKNDLVGGFAMIGKTVLVFVLCSVFLVFGTSLMKGVNTISGGLQGSFLKAGLVFDGSSQNIDSNQPEAGTTAVLRNTYFDTAVYRPYLLMNYGTTDEKAITKNNSNRIDDLLKQKKDSGSDNVVKQENKRQNNKYMQDGDEGINTKLAVGLIAPMITLGLGIPLLLISLFNLIIQIGILALLLLVPLSFFVSLLPWFGNSGYKNLARIIGLFFFKAFTAMFIMFLLLIIQIVDSFISPNSVGGYIANSALLIIVAFLMILKRDWIISTVTGGRVATVGAGSNNIRQMAGAASRKIERRTNHRSEQPRPNKPDKSDRESNEPQGRQEQQPYGSKKATPNAREESGRKTSKERPLGAD